MEAWIWWLIWGLLGFAALAIWGFLLYSLTPAVTSIMKSLQKLAVVAEKLDAAASTKPNIQHPKDNLHDSPAQVQSERKTLLGERRKRKEARARRLVTRVKHINLEGRFKDVRKRS